MRNIILDEIINGREKLITKNQMSAVYQLPNGQIAKIFNHNYLIMMMMLNIDLEKKVQIANEIKADKGVLRPNDMICLDNYQFVGYTMNKANGINFNQAEEKQTIEDRSDLYKYAKLHSNIEKVVKNSPDIVFTDLCSCDNIYIDENNNIQIIDYTDLQIKNLKTPMISTSLGNQEQYIKSKKYYQNDLFTKELDIKSLIVLYFLDVFNIDLNSIGKINPMTNKPLTLDDVFYMLNLFDNDFNHKVWKIFKQKSPNEYLGEDIFRIADKYDMLAFRHPFIPDAYIKKLRKK